MGAHGCTFRAHVSERQPVHLEETKHLFCEIDHFRKLLFTNPAPRVGPSATVDKSFLFKPTNEEPAWLGSGWIGLDCINPPKF